MLPSQDDRHFEPALGPGDARIVFQPIIDLSAWSVVGFEALARFSDGAPPPVHLSNAEAVGMREALELELLRLSVKAAGQLPDDLFFTMNASGTTILHEKLEEILSTVPRKWALELFEGSTPADLGTIRARVANLGGELFVDDAGAASADGDRIRASSPDVVKIDRTLFCQYNTDAPARERLEALTHAARNACARLLVEGVECTEDVDLARGLGADLAQGYHLGRPTAPEDLTGVLQGLHQSIGLHTPGI